MSHLIVYNSICKESKGGERSAFLLCVRTDNMFFEITYGIMGALILIVFSYMILKTIYDFLSAFIIFKNTCPKELRSAFAEARNLCISCGIKPGKARIKWMKPDSADTPLYEFERIGFFRSVEIRFSKKILALGTNDRVAQIADLLIVGAAKMKKDRLIKYESLFRKKTCLFPKAILRDDVGNLFVTERENWFDLDEYRRSIQRGWAMIFLIMLVSHRIFDDTDRDRDNYNRNRNKYIR